MKLIVDTNILIASLLKDSTTRKIVLSSVLDLYIPEYLSEEIIKHKHYISKRSNLSEDEIEILLSLLLGSMTIISSSEINKHIEKAKETIGKVDERDVLFVALAYTIPNNGIWTDDKHFEVIEDINIWKTKNVIAYIRKHHSIV